MEYRGFYDYAVEVYRGDELIGTFRYVSNVWFLTLWLDVHPMYMRWTSIAVYHRLSQTLIARYNRTDSIPSKPVA